MTPRKTKQFRMPPQPAEPRPQAREAIGTGKPPGKCIAGGTGVEEGYFSASIKAGKGCSVFVGNAKKPSAVSLQVMSR